MDEAQGEEQLGDIAEVTSDTNTDTIFKVVILRSGDIELEVKNIHNGWCDSKLTAEGRQQIIEASQLLEFDNYTFDLAYCSVLNRCKESLNILLDSLNLGDIEIQQRWELNERHCGSLTGYNKDEIIAKYGTEQVFYWMNSFDHPPPPMTKLHKHYEAIYSNKLYPQNEILPLTESLEMIQKRVITFWNKQVCPNILSGRKILIVTHNGCLQALVQYLDDIEYTNFTDTEIPRSVPFYYKFDETLTPILKDINITNDLERKIADAFLIFDYSKNNTVDIRELGTIIRALGCIPSEEELQEMLLAMEDPEATGIVQLSSFLPYMVKIFNEHKYQPASPDTLLEVFRKLDVEGVGYINKDFFIKIMMEEGEPFTEDEVEEMMTCALDPQTDNIQYEYYINQLLYDPPIEDDTYALAEKVEAERPKEKKRTMSALLNLVTGEDEQ